MFNLQLAVLLYNFNFNTAFNSFYLLFQDLQQLLDNAKEGVVYFSLGSNVKSANLTREKRQIIIDALSELPYTVLWKWEIDFLDRQPPNIITRRWLPQQDVLGKWKQ